MSSISRFRPTYKSQRAQQGNGIPILLTIAGKQRTAGFAMPDGCWYRTMERSVHFWRSGGESIAASKAALTEAQRLGCTGCKVIDGESGDTYLCSMADYEQYGRPVHRAGWEPQLALPLDHWLIIRRDGTQIPPIHERRSEPTAEQMNLFQAVTE